MHILLDCMGFHSNVAVSKIVGGIAASLAVLGIVGALMFEHAGVQAVLIPLVAALVITSAGAFTYRHSVIIDSRKMLVETSKRVLFWMNTRHFGFGEFEAVGVTPSLPSESQNGSTVYYVQLVGPVKLAVPGRSANYERMHSRARRISEVLNLPLETGPRP